MKRGGLGCEPLERQAFALCCSLPIATTMLCAASNSLQTHTSQPTLQFERDVDIWCSKRFESRPVLSKVDRLIPSFRRWAQQFMGPDSSTYEEAVRRHVAETMGFPSEAILPRAQTRGALCGEDVNASRETCSKSESKASEW